MCTNRIQILKFTVKNKKVVFVSHTDTSYTNNFTNTIFSKINDDGL